MIYAGYRANKWLHGDQLLRTWMLMCALTGNTGRAGGGVQTTQLPNGDGLMAYAFNGVGPRLNVAAIALWDYVHSEGYETTKTIYGETLADHFDELPQPGGRKALDSGLLEDPMEDGDHGRPQPGQLARDRQARLPQTRVREARHDRRHDAAHERDVDVLRLRAPGRGSL